MVDVMAATPTVPIEQLRLLGVTPERDTLAACEKYLKACGIPCWRTNVAPVYLRGRDGRRYKIKGLPKGHADLAGVLPPDGRALYVETKSRGRGLTTMQEAWQIWVSRAGALVLTVRSVEELRQGLRAAGRDVR
jgi:hypothetical protein